MAQPEEIPESGPLCKNQKKFSWIKAYINKRGSSNLLGSCQIRTIKIKNSWEQAKHPSSHAKLSETSRRAYSNPQCCSLHPYPHSLCPLLPSQPNGDPGRTRKAAVMPEQRPASPTLLMTASQDCSDIPTIHIGYPLLALKEISINAGNIPSFPNHF